MKIKEVASCEINDHGRILSANRPFCRLFGFSEAMVEWHYLQDVFRFDADWNSFVQSPAAKTAHFIVRLKNRKGRSFIASISREAEWESGKAVYRNSFRKISDVSDANVEDLGRENVPFEALRTIAL